MNDQTSYVIIDKGLEDTEQSCILVDNGKFFGMGYLPSEYELTNIEDVKEHLISYRANNYIRNLITGHKERFPSAIIELARSASNSNSNKNL